MRMDSMTMDHGAGKGRTRVPIPDPRVGTRWVEREVLDRQGLLCWSCDDAIIFEDSGVCIDCKEERIWMGEDND